MAATPILHSQYSLRNSPTLTSPCFNRSRPCPNPNSSPSNSRSSMVTKLPAQNNLVTGQVKILKRGGAVPPGFIKKEDKQTPEKQIQVLKGNIKVDNVNDDVAFFPGWSCVSSPSPSSVPLPRFLAINGN